MAKGKSVFVCQSCGYESPRWLGRCICGAWDSMREEKIIEDKRSGGLAPKDGSRRGVPQPLREVKGSQHQRMNCGIGEVNRVLGGGIVNGSLTLISGEPGIGKSTIIAQISNYMAKNYGKVLYVSGEESEEQIKLRADRICDDLSDKLYILSETNLENIEEACNQIEPVFLVIDSIQTLYSSDLEAAPGSVSQVRHCGNRLMHLGKGQGIGTFIVAHVTKSGELAGPKVVEHLVDTVLHFGGERSSELRILRALKNRFGTTSEIGAFKMMEEGLVEIENISASFLEEHANMAEGSLITAIYEGSRPVLLELQALTAFNNAGFPRRTSVGIDAQRLSMLLAVIQKKLGLSVMTQDAYVNVVGGLKVDSTSVDLAVVLALVSSMKGIQTEHPVIAIGEVGLTGEVRGVKNCEKIVSEALRMGYTKMILPKKNQGQVMDVLKKKVGDGFDVSNLNIKCVTDVKQAVAVYNKMASENNK